LFAFKPVYYQVTIPFPQRPFLFLYDTPARLLVGRNEKACGNEKNFNIKMPSFSIKKQLFVLGLHAQFYKMSLIFPFLLINYMKRKALCSQIEILQ
jgi:hypothetical protein